MEHRFTFQHSLHPGTVFAFPRLGCSLAYWRLVLATMLSTVALLILLFALERTVAPVRASGAVHYVAPGGAGACGVSPCYDSVQSAVDAASDGDVILVAGGIYTGVHTVGSLSQMVYLSKSLTLRGGYTVTDWSTSHPVSYPTILDAEGLGRVLYIASNDVTVEGFHIRRGSSSNGGAVYVASGNAVIQTNKVYSNTADSAGGGFYIAGGSSIVRSNDISTNTAGVMGGAIYVQAGAPAIDGNQIYNNSVPTSAGNDQGGGGIYVAGGSPTILGNSIYNNTTNKSGAGIHIWSDGSVRVERNAIHHNSAAYRSSGIYIRGGNHTIRNNLIYSNAASGGGCGIGYFLSGGIIENNTIYRNDGIAIYNENDSSSYTIRNNIIVSNTADAFVYAACNYCDVWGNGVDIGIGVGSIISDPLFVDASKPDLHLLSGSPAIDAANPLLFPVDDYEGRARPLGAAADMGAYEYYRGNCFAQVDGATQVYTSVQAAVNVVATPGKLVKVAGTCGALATTVSGSTFTQTVYLTRSLILQGGYVTSVIDANGYWISPTLSNVTTLDGQGLGRGLYISATDVVTVEMLRIINGKAASAGGPDAGGGVYVVNGALVASATSLISNVAASGGGLYNLGGAVTVRNNSAVFRNSATSGGGLYNGNGALTVNQAWIYSNTAASGGGIYNAGTALVQANRIYSNTATSGGGFYNQTGSATLENNFIYTNTATALGGAVYVGGAATLENDTLYANRAATGGALYQVGGTMLVTNTILVGNTATSTGGGVYVNAGTAALAYNDLWQNSPNHGNVTSTQSIWVNPLFENAPAGDLHLQPDSPAVDHGDPRTALNVDIDGDWRPLDGGYDIGADERPRPGVTLEPPADAQSGAPGATVVYRLNITNTGSVTDTFDLTYTNSMTNWVVTYSPPSITLGPMVNLVCYGCSGTAYVSVTVPPASAYLISGTTNTTYVTATSLGNSVWDSATDTTAVARSIGVVVAPDLFANLSPNETFTFTHRVTNTGNYTDTFTLAVSGWYAAGSPTPTQITLGPYGWPSSSQQVQFTVTVPITAAAFLTKTNVLVATSNTDGNKSGWAIDTITTKSTVGARYVATNGDDTDNNCTLDLFPCKTVSHAVEQAAGGDTIRVAAGAFSEGELRINKNIILLGGYPAFVPGSNSNWSQPRDPVFHATILDGQGASRVIYIPGVGLSPEIDGVTIQNGSTAGQGGGLYIETSASPALRNIKFLNNHADSNGGGVYIAGGSLTLDGVSFTGNTAYRGAGLYNSSATLKINNTHFTANVAVDKGGGLYNWSGSLTLTAHSDVRDNAADSGGGVYNVTGGLVITNSLMSANAATSNGGGLYDQSGAATLLNNLVFSNTTGQSGGGLYFSTGYVVLENNTLYGNEAAAGRGGGVYIASATLAITNNLIVKNVAGVAGGGLFAAGVAPGADYNDVWGNTAPSWPDSNVSPGLHSISADPLFADPAGGDFHLSDYSPAIDRGDPDTALDIDYAFDPRPSGQGFDIGAYELGGCFARVNHQGVDGPILFNVQGAIDSAVSPADVVKTAGTCRGVHPLQVAGVTLYQTVHLTRTLTLRGGYLPNVWSDPPQGGPTILDPQGLGRAIYISGAITPVIEGFVLRNGDAGSLGGGPGGQSAGGAIYNSGGQTVVSGTAFYNSAATFGGGLYNANGGVVTLTLSTLNHNTAGLAGGGAYNYDGALFVTGAAILSNMAGQGGGLFNSQFGTLIVVSRTSILSNTATAGGGVYNESGGVFTLQSGMIHDNDAGTGGGIYVAGGTASLENSMVFSNTATSGNGGGANVAGGVVRVQNDTLYANHAAANGGALYQSAGTLVVNNTILVSNTAASAGGAVYASALAAGTDYNDMMGNTAPSFPGSNLSLGSHSIAVDPWFVGPAAGDLHIRDGSPVADRGDPNTALTTDFDDDIRPSHFGFDIGADEIGGCFAKINDGAALYGSLAKAIALTSSPTDTIKIAGRCVGVQPVADGGQVYTQTVYLTKTLTLRGGYTITNWIISDPYANPTTLDALGLGRVIVISGTITPTIEGLNIVRGVSSLAGGGVYVLSGSPFFSATMFMTNTAVSGAGLYNVSGAVTVFASIARGNTASSNGGGLDNNGGTLVVSRTSIYSNTAASGGGLYNAATALVQASRIYSNVATSGGGFYNQVGLATLQNNLIYTNTATNGGGVHIAGGSVRVENDTLYANRGASQGGGLYNASGATLLVTNTIVVSNTAGAGGFGIYNAGSAALDYNDVWGNTPGNSNVATGAHSIAADPLFVDAARADLHLTMSSPAVDRGSPATLLTVDLDGNSRPAMNGFDIGAYELSGCFAQNGRTGTVYGSVQRAVNTANSGDLIKLAGYCWGVQGGTPYTQTVYITKSLTLRGGYTITNWITSYPVTQPTTLDALGLGRTAFISATTPVTIESVRLGKGNAALGGGPNWGGAVYNVNAALLLSNTVLFNSTAANGGGLYNTGGQMTLQRNVIYGNTASAGDGGGVYNASGLPTLQGNVIHHNTAVRGGGFYNAAGNSMLQNNVFYLNTASNSGGAIYNAGGAASVLNNTLYANSAVTGGAMYNAGPSLNVVNAILASNTATTTAGVYSSAGAANLSYSDLFGNAASAFTDTFGVTPGLGNFASDPLFVNAAGGDLHLTLGSPAIDVGDPATTVNVDMDGEPRPMQYTFDVGADEFAGCYARMNHLGNDYPIRYSVQDAIDEVVGGGYLPTDVVKVAGACWGVRSKNGAKQIAYIDAGRSLTLQGGYALNNWAAPDPAVNVTTLDARRRGRVVYVGSGASAAINGFTLKGGDASQAGVDTTVGGGVYNANGALTLQSDTVTTNTATYGGGLYSNNGTLSASSSEFTGNHAANSGGGIYNNAGSMSLDQSSVTLNSANDGGGIYSRASLSLNLTPVTFNSAANDGGGLYISGGDVNLADALCTPCSEIDYNTAGRNGGGAYLNGGSLSTGVNWVNYNIAGSNGGAIYNNGGNVAYSVGRFISNEATHGSGGAMYQTGAGAQATLQNLLIIGNTAANGSGGALYTSSGAFIVINGTLVDNAAGNAGGGLYSIGGTLAVTNTIVVSNTAGAGAAGGIHIVGGSYTTDYNDVWHNSPSDANIALNSTNISQDPQFAPGGYSLSSTSPCIDSGVTVPIPPARIWDDCCLVPRPQGRAWDMGRYEFPQIVSVDVSDSTLWADPGQTVVHHNTIWNNGNLTDAFTITVTGPWLAGTFTVTTPPLGPGQSWPLNVTVTVPITATTCDQSVVSVLVTSQRNPSVRKSGTDTTNVNLIPSMELAPDPGVGSAQPGQVVTFTHVLTNNSNTCAADQFDLSFLNSQYSWSSLVTSPTIYLSRGHTATVQVLVHLYAWAPAYVVDQATVKATLTVSPTHAAVAADLTTVNPMAATRYVSVNGKDDSNCADQDHGACATVRYAVSQAEPGDEIHVSQGLYQGAFTGTLPITKTVIVQGGYTNNDWDLAPDPARRPTTLDAQGQSRVIMITGNITPSVAGLRITGGDADEGGGVYIQTTLPVTLAANVIHRNVAVRGGGVYVASGGVILQNSIVYTNSAASDGGGVYVGAGAATLVNDTLYDNLADVGGALYQAGGAMNIANTILVSNTATTAGGAVYASGGAQSLAHNNVFGNAPDYGNVALGAGAVEADPLFRDATAGDFHLTANSPAINQGQTVLLATDLEGNLRPQLGAYDIGAFEFTAQPGLQLVPAFASQHTLASLVTYQHVLTNTGNYRDTITLTASVDQPWPVTVTPSPTVTLDPLQATTVYVTITVPGGTLTGTIGTTTITATSSQSPTSFARAIDTTFFQGEAEVRIAKSVKPAAGWLGPGYPVTYTLVYTNEGPSVATGVVITDLVPITLTRITFASSGASITARPGITFAWDVVGTLPVGAKGIITITGNVITQGLAPVVGTLVNTTYITTTQNDLTASDNLASAVSSLDSAPPNIPTLPLVSPANNTMTSTQAIIFTWKPFDDRFGSLDGSGVISYQFILSGSSFYTGAAVYSPTTSYAISSVPYGVYTWTVRAFDAVGNASGLASSYAITVGIPGLNVTKQVVPVTPVAGAPFTYNLTISNTGPIPATGVVVTDAIPVGARYISGGDSFNNGTVTWTGLTVGSFSAAQATFVVSACQAVTNTTYRVVTSTQGINSPWGAALPTTPALPTIVTDFESDSSVGTNQTVYFTSTTATDGGSIVGWRWNWGDGQTGTGIAATHAYTMAGVFTVTLTVSDTCGFVQNASHTITVHGVPQLTMSKSSVPGGNVSPGDRITYTLRITNTGNEDASGVIITDVTPLYTTFVGAGVVPPALGSVASSPAPGGTGPVVWQLTTPITTPGGVAAVTLTVRVDNPLNNKTSIVNSAYTVTSVHIAAPAAGKPVTNTVTALPALAITKNAPGSVPANTPLTYTIRYTNTGNGNAVGVVVTDALPLNISGGYATPPFSGTIGAGKVITWYLPDLPGINGAGSITLIVTPTASVYGTLLNTVGITCSDGVSSIGGPVAVTTFHTDPAALTIAPPDAAVQAGFTQAYQVTAADVYGNQWNATNSVSLTVSAGGYLGTPPGNNVFTATTPVGTYVITATAFNGVFITTTVNVTVGAPVSMTILPRNATVTAGQSVIYTSTIADAYGNSANGTLSTTFTAGGGNVFYGNVLSAMVAGTWPVTGVYVLGPMDATSVTILPGPLARLSIGPVTTRTAGVGFVVMVTALDGFNNTVTSFANPISLTDSSGTLVPTSWNTWSGGVATPVVTVTRAMASDQVTATLAATPTIWVVSSPFAVLPNGPATVTLQINPQPVPLGATTHLTATVVDSYTNPVANGTIVTFTTAAGVFSNGLTTFTTTTASGVAMAVLTASCTSQAVTLAAQAGAVVTQTQVSFVTPGIVQSVSLAVQPDQLPVGGVTAALTATLRDCGSNLVGSGIPVSFAIAPVWAAIAPSNTTAIAGVATAVLTSPTTAGTSVVTASSGSLWATAVVTFTPLSAYTVTVSASPQRIAPGGAASVIAAVADLYGNPVADNTPVTFTATMGAVTPGLVGTTNGRGTATFTAGSTLGTAIVTATVDSSIRAATTITISQFYIYMPLVLRNYVPGKNLVVSAINTFTAPADVSVVIENTGDRAVTDTFWVTLYMDPTSPVQINKSWYNLGCPNGMVWSVTTPVQAGQSLTLTLANAVPDPIFTKWPPTSAGGHSLWAQVDSFAASGTTGLVQETNESDNIAGPVTLHVP